MPAGSTPMKSPPCCCESIPAASPRRRRSLSRITSSAPGWKTAAVRMSEAAPPRVVCAGMAVLDQVFFVDRFPAANTKARADAFFSVVGGCAANAAIAIVRLGGHAELAAAIGGPPQDDIGDRILSTLAHEGVACDAVVRVPEAQSTIS